MSSCLISSQKLPKMAIFLILVNCTHEQFLGGKVSSHLYKYRQNWWWWWAIIDLLLVPASLSIPLLFYKQVLWKSLERGCGIQDREFLLFQWRKEWDRDHPCRIWRLSSVSSWPAWMSLIESCFHNLFLQFLMSDNYYIPSLLSHKLTASEHNYWKTLGVTMNSLKNSSRQDSELFSVFSFWFFSQHIRGIKGEGIIKCRCLIINT